MNVKEFLKDNVLLLDGGTGTLMIEGGLALGEAPERWNVSRADFVTAIHKAYFDAGSNAVCTNTFGANPLKFDERELETLVKAAVENADAARTASIGKQPKFIALDIGPLGKL